MRPGCPAPPGRTAATHSRLLYDVLGAVYDWLGFDVVGDPVFRDLVIARIVEPTSKARRRAGAGRSGCRSGVLQDDCSATSRKVNTGKYRDVIAEKCFAHAADCGGLSLLLYDVTTLYFEAETEDDLRKVGFSNYAEAAVMPRSWRLWWCSCCSAGLAGVTRAA